MLGEIVASIAGVVRVAQADAPSDVILVCEHASRHLPAAYAGMGLSPEGQVAHIAWDPGALAVAEAMARRLGAALVSAEVSRLVFDLNRPPDAAAAMPETSETWEIPRNRGLGVPERLARCREVYMPFHQTLERLVAGRLALGRRPVIVTVHSFTPTWFGKPRPVELGIIHDADPALALALLAEAQVHGGMKVVLNAPYDAADGVTHMLRLHATPYGLANVMIEIRNDLIETTEQQEAMAEALTTALVRALENLAGDRPGAVA